MKRLLPRLLSCLPLTALLLTTMGIGPCDSQPLGSVDAGPTCTSDGKTYPLGAKFPAADGCNTCTCLTDGVACTLLSCAKDGSPSTDGAPATGCLYAGTKYAVGAMFPDTDGCNKCSCMADGQVACTLIGCADASADGPAACTYNGAPRKDGESFLAVDGCNTCWCSSATGVSCTKKACLPDASAVDGGGTCQYQGITYAVNDTFPASDGCNTCTCTSGGLAACTLKACASPDASTRVPCTFGRDQTCNEDPAVSSLRGTCLADGTCKCVAGTSPYTGRCLNPANTTGTSCEYAGTIYPAGSIARCPDGCGTCSCRNGALVNTAGACTSCTDVLFTSGPCAAESEWKKQAIGCAAIGKYLTTLSLNACADGSTYGSGNYKCCDTPPPCGNNFCKPGVEYCALATVGGVYAIATCVAYSTGCTTCDCARKDVTPKLQATCGTSAVTCTDGVSAIQSTDTSQTLVVSCTAP